MPSKLQFYAQMADQAAKQITGSYQSWISFLQTAILRHPDKLEFTLSAFRLLLPWWQQKTHSSPYCSHR